ncbi:SDR family oxidoreductase [Cellulomonas sp. ATA003]|uniref:SDR family oxidoreductase n=1 Tax=Cellulomonas sp. ATA003 TaxID=3073064 RepID=UPI002873C63F|nr:SDR family oxidoreductase [Cellulomonas sp. ATA003]WNB85805.1 SDR family oxidoreductase [Cellulomonas sp. ATA003]
MKIAIAGGHGQIALRLSRLLTDRGHEVVSLVRNPDHTADVEATGATAAVCDLETATADDLAAHLTGADAVVFAAGAGPGSGPERKDTVDRGGAVLLADAAEIAGARRYVLVSSMGAGSEPPAGTDETFVAYLDAKTAAEEDLRARDLDWTVLRPGGLTDDAGADRVRLQPSVPQGEIPRDDVALVLTHLLEEPRTAGLVLELVGGDWPADAAVADLVRTHGTGNAGA